MLYILSQSIVVLRAYWDLVNPNSGSKQTFLLKRYEIQKLESTLSIYLVIESIERQGELEIFDQNSSESRSGSELSRKRRTPIYSG